MMAKRYKDKDGMYLEICETREGFRVGWYDVEGQSVEAFPDDSVLSGIDEAPTDRSAWENWTAYWAMRPFFSGTWKERDPHYFSCEAHAKKALRAANEALITGGAPWPSWAILARDAGWTPPKEWKP